MGGVLSVCVWGGGGAVCLCVCVCVYVCVTKWHVPK